MKYRILFSIVFGLSMLGCTETDSLEEQAKIPITFSTSVGKQTRYIIDGQTYPDGLNFGIWAFLKAQGESDYDYTIPFMHDTEIEKFEYGWVTKEDYYYWPVYGKLKFVAYSPYDIDTPTYSTTDGLTFTDVSPYYGDNQQGYDDIDFMYTEDASATDKTSADAPVGLLFKHALTQVRFTASANIPNVTYKITELKLGEVKDVGTFKTLPTPNWSDLKTLNSNLSWFIFFKGEQVISNSEEQVGLSVLYIPQPVDGLELKMKYDVTFNGVTESVRKTISLSGAPWEMNQKIKYALSFSMNEITFTPTIEDWTTGADIPIID